MPLFALTDAALTVKVALHLALFPAHLLHDMAPCFYEAVRRPTPAPDLRLTLVHRG